MNKQNNDWRELYKIKFLYPNLINDENRCDISKALIAERNNYTKKNCEKILDFIENLLKEQLNNERERIIKIIDIKPIKRNEPEITRFMDYGEKVIKGYRRWLKLQIREQRQKLNLIKGEI